MHKLTTISLFCGAGGLDIGFENAGFKTIWANDFDKDACSTFKHWSDAEVICEDIEKINTKNIPKSDIIIGGYPCQGFSLAGPRKLNDARNKLYKSYVKIVKEKQPLAFVAENVKGLLTMGGGAIIDAMIKEFSDCGYDVSYKLLNAKDYEVPQDRKRVFIIGFRKDLKINFIFPKAQENFVTLKDTIYNLPAPEKSELCIQPYSSRYMSRNRKRNWDDVSFTIPAMAKQVPLWPGSPDMIKIDKDNWIFGEGETRRLSYIEAALIQTFPKDILFYGNLTSKYKQIGNAVPCKLAEAVGTNIYNILNTM